MRLGSVNEELGMKQHLLQPSVRELCPLKWRGSVIPGTSLRQGKHTVICTHQRGYRNEEVTPTLFFIKDRTQALSSGGTGYFV